MTDHNPAISLREARQRKSEAASPSPESNSQLVSGWSAYQESRLEAVTHRSYTFRVKLFVTFLRDEPIVSVQRSDVWLYIEEVLTKGRRGCSLYQSKGLRVLQPVCLLGLDLDGCNVKCPDRKPLKRVTIEHHLQPLVSLFTYLYRHDHVKTNVAAEVLKEWSEENRRPEVTPEFRRFTVLEVERLLRLTPQPHLKTGIATMGLTGVRVEELQRLSVAPEYFNVKEGWIKLPHRPGQKRRGETKLWLTEELADWLAIYMGWWEKKVKRDEDGNPTHTRLLLTARGTHWKSYKTFLSAFKEQLRRAGILKGDEDEYNTLTPHDLRHWLTTQLLDAKTPDYFVALYRGDTRGVIADDYTHLTEEKKRSEFLRYAPRIKF